MPEYEVTLAENLRSYRRKVIDAETDAEAVEKAKALDWLVMQGVSNLESCTEDDVKELGGQAFVNATKRVEDKVAEAVYRAEYGHDVNLEEESND